MTVRGICPLLVQHVASTQQVATEGVVLRCMEEQPPKPATDLLTATIIHIYLF